LDEPAMPPTPVIGTPPVPTTPDGELELHAINEASDTTAAKLKREMRIRRE
jgi:hypothetical protein